MMTPKQLIVLTNEDDAHVRMVEAHLPQALIRIDPHISRLTYRLTRDKILVICDGRPLDNVSSVWYRKPTPFTVDNLKVSPDYFEYAQTTLQSHIARLRSQFSTARWVSDYYAIQRAGSKALQLEIARRLGFAVPDTTITADSREARAFFKSHEWTIIKTSAAQFPNIGQSNSFFFARKVHCDSQVDLTNLHLAPAIFQQAIDAIADIRVTVVGDNTFAARIDEIAENSLSEVRDWRLDQLTGKRDFVATAIPKDLGARCIQLVKKMHLQFGAIDLVVDRHNKIWFLEINPNGQWGFIEESTGLPIGKAIADLLWR